MGGLAWCIQNCAVGLDVDLLYKAKEASFIDDVDRGQQTCMGKGNLSYASIAFRYDASLTAIQKRFITKMMKIMFICSFRRTPPLGKRYP